MRDGYNNAQIEIIELDVNDIVTSSWCESDVCPAYYIECPSHYSTSIGE